MHLDWQCPDCREQHLDMIEGTKVLENNQSTIECTSCRHKFRVSSVSYKIEVKCILTDCDTQLKSSSSMNIF